LGSDSRNIELFMPRSVPQTEYGFRNRRGSRRRAGAKRAWSGGLASLFWAAVALALAIEAAEPVQADPPGSVAAMLTGRDPIPIPTLGGKQFWADELFFHQWRIQRSAITGECRLLDKHNLRHASGTWLQCRAALQEIKRTRRLPPMQGEGVIVLHGLFRTRSSMAELCEALEAEGGYTVFNVSYPTTRRSVAAHAAALGKIIRSLHGIERIHFVGHSLGNIVIRRYLADEFSEQSDREPDQRLGRFVMLGPPNRGSLMALSLGENELFATLAGRPGQQLGLQWGRLADELATPPIPFGVIAGGLGDGQGYNPLLPGDDDGIVTVATTRLAGARDFARLPALHTTMMEYDRVIEYTLRFLEKGHFVGPDRRRPIPEAADE
jgi:pimeloyl-ACP methyl ester carboxylesterase